MHSISEEQVNKRADIYRPPNVHQIFDTYYLTQTSYSKRDVISILQVRQALSTMLCCFPACPPTL